MELRSLHAWAGGSLSGTSAETYRIKGEPSREIAEVMLIAILKPFQAVRP
jgi:hypothetical protein